MLIYLFQLSIALHLSLLEHSSCGLIGKLLIVLQKNLKMEHKCSMTTVKQKDISLKAYSIKNSEEQLFL